MSRKISISECVEQFPFLGKWSRDSNGEYVIVDGMNSAQYKVQQRNESDSPKLGAGVLYSRDSKGIVADWVERANVAWRQDSPNTWDDYRQLRKKHFDKLSSMELVDFLRGRRSYRKEKSNDSIPEWQQKLRALKEDLKEKESFRSKDAFEEDWDFILDVCLPKIKNLPILSQEFKALAEAMCSFPWKFLDEVGDILKEKIKEAPYSQLEKIGEVISKFEMEGLSSILTAFKWLKDPNRNQKRIEAAQSIFSERQMIRRVLEIQDAVEANAILDAIGTSPRDLVTRHSLVLDLESDGAEISEVAWVVGGKDREAQKEDIKDALQELGAAMRDALLIVGHNILDWDAPILAKHGCPIPPDKPIWDTLLISFLLEPWTVTYALRGPHTAVDDAKLCRKLFLKQVDRFGARKALAVLSEASNQGNEDFYRLSVERMPVLNPESPEWVKSLEGGRRYAAPDAWLGQLRWCPGIAVGDSQGFWNVSPEWLGARIKQERDPSLIVLLSVLKRAREKGVYLHRDMVPVWLKDSKPVKALEETLGKFPLAIDKDTKRFVAFSAMEKSDDLQGKIDTLFSSLEQWVSVTWDRNEPEKQDPNVLAFKDPVSDQIGSEKPFKILQFMRHPTSNLPELQITTQIMRWAEEVLYPNSKDVQSYLVETLMRFLAVAEKVGKQQVPILFVDNDGRKNKQKDIDLVMVLRQALNLTGKSLDPQRYHSRVRQLQIASEARLCLVAPISDLHKWLALSDVADIPILPVIESLPLETWFLLDRQEQKKQSDGDESDTPEEFAEDAGTVEENGTTGVTEPTDIDDLTPSGQSKRRASLTSQVIRKAAKLTEKYLEKWLSDMAGPLGERFSFTVIDPRVQSVARDAERLAIIKDPEQRQRYEEVIGQFIPRIERNEPPMSMDALRSFARTNNFIPRDKDFFPYQEEPLTAILKRDPDLTLLVRLPTGAGKSLIFQAPALYRGLDTQNLTLVISPLKALMEDQVSGLWEKQFYDEVEYLSSDRPWWETTQVLQGVLDHTVKVLYVAPERLRSERFMSILQRRMKEDGGLEYLVFDEAHCISQWGHEFRPDYLYASIVVSKLREQYPFPVLLFSATVPDATKTGIQDALGVQELTLIPQEIQEPVKKEIIIQPERVCGEVLAYKDEDWDLDERVGPIVEEVEHSDRESAVIVFVQRRAHAEVVADMLDDRLKNVIGKGKVAYYHAGMPAAERTEIYERYKNRELKVLVATKAFGMGMDIKHIHHCIHLSPSTYLEDYLQEVGRIGRDREKDRLHAKLLYSDDDWDLAFSIHVNSRMTIEKIDAFWDALKDMRGEESGNIVVLPTEGCSRLPEDPFQKGSASSRSTKIRMALYWLEKVQRVRILRQLPSVLEVSVKQSALDRIARDPERPVARAIANFVSLDAEGNAESFIAKAAGDRQEKILDLHALGSVCSLTPDEVLKEIWELSKGEDKALTVETDLVLSPGPLIREVKSIQKKGDETTALGRELCEWTRNHGMDAIKALKQHHGEPLDWGSMGISFIEMPGEKIDAKLRRAQEKALVKLLRLAGGRLERVKGNEEENHRRICFRSLSNVKRDHCEKVIATAINIWEVVNRKFRNNANQGKQKQVLKVKLSELLDCCIDIPRVRDIEQALSLLKCMGLLQARDRLLPTSYLLELKDAETPLNLESVERDVAEVNLMAEMRFRAMQAFCYIDEDEQEEFLIQYFKQSNAACLRDFLVNFLEVKKDDSRINQIVNAITKGPAQEYLDRFLRIDEQRDVIEAVVDKHMLVNAGPGSGKTSVLIARIVYLIREYLDHKGGVPPDQIMVLAFNRAVVQEIRRRVRNVFKEIGYGGYVGRLKVRTFHALAAKHVDREEQFEKKTLLETFACQLDEATAKEIAGNARIIMVDEFQDMNDARWTILTKLQKANDARIFAIGDDDQDIVAWDRNGKSCEKYFKAFKETYQPAIMNLTTNFRSAPEIVARSQKKVSRLIHQREKKVPLRADEQNSIGKVICRAACSVDHVRNVLLHELESARPKNQSIAILCRTNAEVAEWHEKLKGEFRKEELPKLKVQGSARYPLAWLRHVAVWLDLMKDEKGQPLPQSLSQELRKWVFTKWLEKDIPEAREAKGKGDPKESDYYRQLCNLWVWCREDNPSARVSDLIEFVNDLNTDDYDKMEDQQSPKKKEFQAVISTIHKVKGLEFDSVVIPPSEAPFPFPDPNKGDLKEEAEAEAKTYYVGMTRAKSKLVYFVGDREKKWAKKERYDGVQSRRKMLDGAPDEVFIAWPGWNDAVQSKIFSELPVKAPVVINVRRNTDGEPAVDLSSNGKVGQLSKNEARKFNPNKRYRSDLRVAAVLRYPLSEEQYRGDKHWIWEKLIDNVKKQGWLWLVCVQGFYELNTSNGTDWCYDNESDLPF